MFNTKNVLDALEKALTDEGLEYLSTALKVDWGNVTDDVLTGTFTFDVKLKITPLSSVACGSVVKIGDTEFIVLEHQKDRTLLITKDIVCGSPFGDTTIFLRSEAFEEKIVKPMVSKFTAAGITIAGTTVDLTAEDGTIHQIYAACTVKLGLLSVDQYRKFRRYLKPLDESWWLATPCTYKDDDGIFDQYVVVINGNTGFTDCQNIKCAAGFRPICTLAGYTRVEVVEPFKE